MLSEGKVVVVDLEQIFFREEPCPWEENVNFGGIGSLMKNFRLAKNPYLYLPLLTPLPLPLRRPRKPVQIWEIWELDNMRDLSVVDAGSLPTSSCVSPV
jgi:hypothetical protein